MKNKVISFSIKQNKHLFLHQLFYWFFGESTINTETTLSEDVKQKRAIKYLQQLLNPRTSNPINLLDEDMQIIFSKNTYQLNLSFSGELPTKFIFFSRRARNIYFQDKLQAIINTLFRYGICKTNQLVYLRSRGQKLIEITEIENEESNIWQRKKEFYGPKDNFHIINLTLSLTEKGALLIEEALNALKQ